MAKVGRIRVYSHHFVISHMNPNVKVVVWSFIRDYIEYQQMYKRGRGMVSIPKKMFCASDRARSEFRIHINDINNLLGVLHQAGFVQSVFDIEYYDAPEGVESAFSMNRLFTTRDYQEPVVKYLCKDIPSKMVPLSTGLGKGYCTFKAIEKLGVRFGVIVPGKYVDKWVDETLEMFPATWIENEDTDEEEAVTYKDGLTKDDICVIRGSKALKDIIELALNGEYHYKAMVITSTTMQNFIKAYEHGNMDGYDCTPVELFGVLGIGVRVIDEVHENFHLNFKMELYTHVKTSISLTATLEGDNGFLNRMAAIMFPLRDRITVIAPPKYIAATSLEYRLGNPSNFIWLGKQGMYNHIEYEFSIMKQAKALSNYIDMITDIIENNFISVREEGQKMLIFAGSVEMCTILSEHLTEVYPELSVGRYTGEDDFTALHVNDLVVSTLGSSGTAVDILNLRLSLMTTALGSMQKNNQAVGRTRPLKGWPDVTPQFLYLTCTDIDIHMKYHRKKKDIFSARVKSHNSLRTNYVI